MRYSLLSWDEDTQDDVDLGKKAYFQQPMNPGKMLLSALGFLLDLSARAVEQFAAFGLLLASLVLFLASREFVYGSPYGTGCRTQTVQVYPSGTETDNFKVLRKYQDMKKISRAINGAFDKTLLAYLLDSSLLVAAFIEAVLVKAIPLRLVVYNILTYFAVACFIFLMAIKVTDKVPKQKFDNIRLLVMHTSKMCR